MKVKVFNDNPHLETWKETFKGEEVIVKRGDPIEMDIFEATEFKGQYYPPVKLADGTQDPKSFKMIRVEQYDPKALHQESEKTKSHRCHVCKKPFATEKLLVTHAVSEHEELLVADDEEEVITEVVARKKPGPKPKVQTQETAE